VFKLVLNKYRSFPAGRGSRWQLAVETTTKRMQLCSAIFQMTGVRLGNASLLASRSGFFKEISQVHVNDHSKRFCFDFKIVANEFHRWMHCHYLVVVTFCVFMFYVSRSSYYFIMVTHVRKLFVSCMVE
jgi:hypothetical protein